MQKSEQDIVSVWWYWHTSGSTLLPDLHHFIVLPVAVAGVAPLSAGHAEARQHDMPLSAQPKGEAVLLHRARTLSTHLHGSSVVVVIEVVVIVVVVVVVIVVVVVVVVDVEVVSGHSPSPGWQSVDPAQALPCLLRGKSTL